VQSLLAHERSPCATDEALIATNIEHAHMHLPDHIDLSRPLAVQLTHNPRPARCPQPSAPRAPSRSLWFCQGSYGPAKSALQPSSENVARNNSENVARKHGLTQRGKTSEVVKRLQEYRSIVDRSTSTS
jgi:hypothetical protein